MEPLILITTQFLLIFVIWLAIRLNDRIKVPHSLERNRSNPNPNLNPNLNPKGEI